MVTKFLRAAALRNARLSGRLPQKGDDTGSLMFAMLLILLATSLAGLMAPVVLIAINGTRTDQTRVASLAAAQSGIDVAMAQIRSAIDSDGNGVLSELPCGTLSGKVSVASNSRYSVTVSYYSTDPRGQSSSWLTANAITCISGGGVYKSPGFGLLVSQGSDQAAAFTTLNSRTVQATYLFKSTNANIVGGLIHVFKSSSTTDLCIDAGSSSPSVGTNVTMRPCVDGRAQQIWAYNQDLTISLVSSIGGSQPNGLCLDAGSPENDNNLVALQPCGVPTLIQQQWSINNAANFQGTTDGVNANGPCFGVLNPNVSGSLLAIANSYCGGGVGDYTNVRNWQPAASVGAGAAGASSGQLVNFNQFGRCLDVTEQNLSYPGGYLIVWPCKQAPDPTNVLWNQRWTMPTAAASVPNATTGFITVNPSNTRYCLMSPLSTAANKYVFETQCPSSGSPANLTWTVYGKTTRYATSYEITDSNGNCLQPTDQTVASPDLYPAGNNISKTIVAPCNGSTLQKWNADPGIQSPLPLKDIGEK